jgi:hypothetical protein
MTERKNLVKIFIIYIIGFIVFSIIMIIQILSVERQPGIVPFSGLTEASHFIVFFFILPFILSIAAVLIFPRIFPALLLKSKKIVYRRYKDAFIETDLDAFTPKKIIIRLIYIFLLTLGFLAIVVPLMSDEVARMFINTGTVDFYEDEGLDLRFVLPVLMTITFSFIFPIVIGLWSIGWALADSGLVHYSGLEGQKERYDKLFEIEPTHMKYNNYLKGYAGISSVVFLISLAIYFTGFQGRATDVMMVILIPAFSILYSIPPYLVYGLEKGKFQKLRKGLPEAKRIAEADFIIKKE